MEKKFNTDLNNYFIVSFINSILFFSKCLFICFFSYVFVVLIEYHFTEIFENIEEASKIALLNQQLEEKASKIVLLNEQLEQQKKLIEIDLISKGNDLKLLEEKKKFLEIDLISKMHDRTILKDNVSTIAFIVSVGIFTVIILYNK